MVVVVVFCLLQVISNGFLSFEVEYTDTYFISTSFTIVAPFWTDIDPRIFGSIFYRNNLIQSQCIQEIVEETFLVSNFHVASSFVATYSEVREFRQTGNNKVSTQ